MVGVDPVDFGELRGEVKAIREDLEVMKRDMRILLDTREQGRTLVRIVVTAVTILSAAAGWVAEKVAHAQWGGR